MTTQARERSSNCQTGEVRLYPRGEGEDEQMTGETAVYPLCLVQRQCSQSINPGGQKMTTAPGRD